MTGFAAATYTSVVLEEKESFGETGDWNIVGNGYNATIVYGDVGSMFVWHASGTAKQTNTEYSLIYYADPWPGDNPGALIGTFETDGAGKFDVADSTDIGFSLPHADDANGNASETNYSGAPDCYDHANGAKLWIVLSDDYAEPAMTRWDPAEYLFETELITYTYDTTTASGLTMISIGDAFNGDTVPIVISNSMNVGSVDLTLSYDPAVVKVTSVANGDMDSMFYNIGVGQVRIGTYQGNSPGIGAEFDLVDVTFESVGSGACDACDFTITVTTFKDATPAGTTMTYDTETGQYCSAVNGDVNANGAVDIHDVMYLAKNIIGLTGYETICEPASDVNGDGIIDISDVMYLAKHIIVITGYETLK